MCCPCNLHLSVLPSLCKCLTNLPGEIHPVLRCLSLLFTVLCIPVGITVAAAAKSAHYSKPLKHFKEVNQSSEGPRGVDNCQACHPSFPVGKKSPEVHTTSPGHQADGQLIPDTLSTILTVHTPPCLCKTHEMLST